MFIEGLICHADVSSKKKLAGGGENIGENRRKYGGKFYFSSQSHCVGEFFDMHFIRYMALTVGRGMTFSF